MPLAAHRKAPNRAREIRERVWAIVERELGGGRKLCSRCNCTLASFAEKCTADLDERCPGFNAIELVKTNARKEIGLS